MVSLQSPMSPAVVKSVTYWVYWQACRTDVGQTGSVQSEIEQARGTVD